MIRYVDSAGWTWEVCELEPQPGATPSRTARWFRSDRAAAASDVEVASDFGVRQPRADRAPEPDRGELYFFSRLGSRKLRRYPSEWFQLARAELEALCARAEEID